MPATPFLGQIIITPYNFAPNGYAMCNGQLLAISQNTALFSLLGTSFGGDGRVSFGLPDLRGRTPIGFGQGTNLSAYNLGDKGGAEAVALTTAQMPAHNHGAAGSSLIGNVVNPTNAVWAKSNLGDKIYETGAATTVAMHPNALSSVGASQPHLNIQPSLVLNYCIALVGIFPSRN